MDLSRVTVFCFAASYVVALALEATALLRGGPPAGLSWWALSRRATLLCVAIAGLFAHLAYLGLRAAGQATPLSSPADWCLVAAAAIAAVYVGVSVRDARSAAGLFLLPIVLALVALAQTASDEPFTAERASLFWGQTHGWLLAAGAASVSIGFVAGLMYLVQSWRLKRKLPPNTGLGLPSLEWLERCNAWSLAASVWLVAGGFGSGVVLAAIGKPTGGRLSGLLADPVVLTSGAMLGWLLVAETFRWAYPPARTGRKVAYLTVTAFGFLAITLASVAAGGVGHGALAAPASEQTATGLPTAAPAGGFPPPEAAQPTESSRVG